MEGLNLVHSSNVRRSLGGWVSTARQCAKRAVPSREEGQLHLSGWEPDCERLCVLEKAAH